ncbi:hypothetical protein GUITHDRAFT_146211 [Guillardia theta CCMP2712]|uniref:Uncharacterized protein n=1 Tax=Guillardia theta (strain CCMP2712) TaxID=905079 RepID=L1IJ75_GUITC|nr:hypothetical protein GUITHDRAFT_146211 [Guillardia theta CCMP2712]EKX35865.1 hypothetical protein GUITHDRAFT_146211 [Guillardia theta CCMP2712]|eukprot:XP_005822845.1 hypothetical protein GUITHDRAFT_146211 [Guillardia theta CCMP2712]
MAGREQGAWGEEEFLQAYAPRGRAGGSCGDLQKLLDEVEGVGERWGVTVQLEEDADEVEHAVAIIRKISDAFSSFKAESETTERRLRERIARLEEQLFQAKQKEAELSARLHVMEKFAVLPHVDQNELGVGAMIDEMLNTAEVNFRLANQVDLLRTAAEEAIRAADYKEQDGEVLYQLWAQDTMHSITAVDGTRAEALENLSAIEEQLLMLQALARKKTRAQLAEMQLVKEISELHHKEIESLKLELQKLYDLLNKKIVDDGKTNSLQDLWNMLKAIMSENSKLSQDLRDLQASLTLKKYETVVEGHQTSSQAPLQPAFSLRKDIPARSDHRIVLASQRGTERKYLTVGQFRSFTQQHLAWKDERGQSTIIGLIGGTKPACRTFGSQDT